MNKPQFSYWTKAIFVFVVSALGTANLLLVDGGTYSDFTQGEWTGLFSLAFVLAGGILGLQEAPSQIASSKRN